MKLIEAEKAKDAIHEYFKSLMVNGASGTDVDRLAVGIGSCLKHDANLLKAIDELPSAEPESISKWKKEFREYVDSLDIARDDWKGIIEYIDELPSTKPFYNITLTDVLKYIDDMPEDVWLEFTACLECRGWELQWCGGDFT